MYTLRSTRIYGKWQKRLRDKRAVERIVQRLVRVEFGNLGDVKPVGGGVFELRIDYGPGYRVYYMRQGAQIILLLAGGDKSSQARDIKRAMDMAKMIGDTYDTA